MKDNQIIMIHTIEIVFITLRECMSVLYVEKSSENERENLVKFSL
jgi:hypothetical protein